MNDVGHLININERKGLPRVYRFKRFIRWFTIFLATAAIIYAIWLIFSKVNVESSKFVKFVPFAIMFLALNSLIKNLFTLNKIVLTKKAIFFKYLSKKGTKIEWASIEKIELNDAKRKMIKILYLEDNKEKVFEFPISFPNMLEIINSIAEMCSELEYDDFIKNVIISEKEKKQYNAKENT